MIKFFASNQYFYRKFFFYDFFIDKVYLSIALSNSEFIWNYSLCKLSLNRAYYNMNLVQLNSIIFYCLEGKGYLFFVVIFFHVTNNFSCVTFFRVMLIRVVPNTTQQLEFLKSFKQQKHGLRVSAYIFNLVNRPFCLLSLFESTARKGRPGTDW